VADSAGAKAGCLGAGRSGNDLPCPDPHPDVPL